MAKKKQVKKVWNVGFKRPPDITDNFLIGQVDAVSEEEAIRVLQGIPHVNRLLAVIQAGERAGREKPSLLLPLYIKPVTERTTYEGRKSPDGRMDAKYNRFSNTEKHIAEICGMIHSRLDVPMEELTALDGSDISIPALIEAGKKEVREAMSGGMEGLPDGFAGLMQLLQQRSRKAVDC